MPPGDSTIRRPIFVTYKVGPPAHFVFKAQFMDKIAQLETIENFAKPVVESLGYRLIEREFVVENGRLILRLYIDKLQPQSGVEGALPAPVITRDSGVTLDDCSTVSRNLSAQLDVEDPIPGKYDLEVSSPGIERPLRYLEDFERFKGETITLRTNKPINGRQNYWGTLTQVDAQNIVMTIDDADFTIPFSALLKARVIKFK